MDTQSLGQSLNISTVSPLGSSGQPTGVPFSEERKFFFLNRFHRRELTTPIFASDFLDYFSKSMEAFQTSSKHSCQVEMAPTLSSKGRDIFE